MITVYATKEDYKKYGSGSLEGIEIDKYLELSSIDINRATLTRIEKRGFNNLTEQQKDLIIKATCLQADYIKDEGFYDDDSISSYSIGGDLTVNEKESTDITDKLNISRSYVSRIEKRALTKILREFIKNNKYNDVDFS